MAEHMLTTDDNPYNPFHDFDSWYSWDEQAGYHTTSFLARITRTSDESSDHDQDVEFERAIQEAVDINAQGNYRKITRDQTPITFELKLG